MDRGFPRNINMDWPGIVGKVDAAFELNGNGLYHFLPVFFSVKVSPGITCMFFFSNRTCSSLLQIKGIYHTL